MRGRSLSCAVPRVPPVVSCRWVNGFTCSGTSVLRSTRPPCAVCLLAATIYMNVRVDSHIRQVPEHGRCTHGAQRLACAVWTIDFGEGGKGIVMSERNTWVTDQDRNSRGKLREAWNTFRPSFMTSHGRGIVLDLLNIGIALNALIGSGPFARRTKEWT